MYYIENNKYPVVNRRGYGHGRNCIKKRRETTDGGVWSITLKEASLCESCVKEALEAGYRLVDTAAAYFNEEAVEKAVKKSGISRKDIILTDSNSIVHQKEMFEEYTRRNHFPNPLY